MKFKDLVCLCWLLLLSAGCTQERLYVNIYEGLHKREELLNPSNELIPPKQHSYDEYKKMREESLRKLPGEAQ